MREEFAFADVKDVFAVCATASTSFADVPADAVTVAVAAAMRMDELAAAIGRYERHGFVVLELVSDPPTPDAMVSLSESLGLGLPFVPPLYTRERSATPAFSRITAVADSADVYHPSFNRSVGLPLHCDGTLQPLGYVKSAMLLCQCPAAEGGETTLFNAAAAFTELVATDPDAAAAVATHGALRRQANINGCTDVNEGPAFTVIDGCLVCGYSVSDTDSWAVPDGVAAADLERAVAFLADASRPGSSYYTELTLTGGQAILFDNTRVSHGRTPYRDGAATTRCLFRTLHLHHPVRSVHLP